MGTGHNPPTRVPLAPFELAKQLEEAVVTSIEVTGETRELVLECFECTAGGSA
jgi:hypothetical protein